MPRLEVFVTFFFERERHRDPDFTFVLPCLCAPSADHLTVLWTFGTCFLLFRFMDSNDVASCLAVLFLQMRLLAVGVPSFLCDGHTLAVAHLNWSCRLRVASSFYGIFFLKNFSNGSFAP